MPQANRFTFTHSEHLSGVTALDAVMRDFSYEKHAHEEIALGVTLGGRQDFVCKGAQYKSVPGNVMLFNQDDVHDGNPGNRSTLSYVMLYIHPDELVPLINCAGKIDRAARSFPETVFDDAVLRNCVVSLSSLVTEKSSSKLEQELLLYETAKRLAQRMGQFQPDQWVYRKDSLLLTVREYVHDNIMELALSVEELSAVANLSKYHFIRLFRRQFGITPHQYVLNCRLNRARAALEKGCSPTTTAQLFGFADVSHLNRRFKRIFGITPKQYQLQLSR